MRKLVTILLGGLIIATPAYADETTNENPGNTEGEFNNQDNFNNQENFDNQDNFNNPDGNYDNPEGQEFNDGNVAPNEGNNEENYEAPQIEENNEAPVIEENPVIEALTEVEEDASIVTEVKQDSYSVRGTVFLDKKPVRAKLKVDKTTIETGDSGQYKAEGLQPGKHTITVIEVNGKKADKSIEVEIKDKNKINIDINLSKDDVSGEKETIQKEDPEIKETSKALIFSVIGVILLTIAGVIALLLHNRKKK